MFFKKPEQRNAVDALLGGLDVFAVLPTGFGKSLIYQAFVQEKRNQNDMSTVVILSPVKSIVADQIKEMKELGISAVELNPNDTDMLTKISEGKFAVVLTSAEDSLNASFLKILKEENHNLSISLIVVDEVHTVETW